ncbi:hypothetical protein VaNZ11_004934 [Volvox africanus]|uniref:FCP1 homology domain-containing protein n=1 Tax=Volvox africanus TaxID=51714 RepID=A0ABQ5RXH9_9CHLO|nr:hypothetical protein VaNZ11_004934 [Volvox africanus]
MLSALRGILQRWVGMTAEVQALEAEEAAAVPAASATPTCSTDYAANASRRLKRPGPSNTDATDLKRPRTAPTAPIDAGANGANPSAGKGSDPDGHIANPADLHPHHATNATRAATTASAPAALNRTLRPQPSVSTASPAAISSASRHIGAISGVVAAPQPQQQMQLQPQQQQQLCQSGEEGSNVNVGHDQPPLQRHQQQELAVQQEQQQREFAATAAIPAAAAVAASIAGSGLTAASGSSDTSSAGPPQGSGNGGAGPAIRNYHHNPHTPHHSDLHHRHDALEEQVFSPAFHLPSSSSPASSNSSPQAASRVGLPLAAAGGGGGGKPSQGNDDAAEAATMVRVTTATAAAAVVAVADGSQSVEVRASHHHSSECMQLHAIDLNVVDGVQVDTDDDELAAGAAAVTTAAAAALTAAAASAAVKIEDATAALRQGRHSGGGAAAAATIVAESREPGGSQQSGPPGKKGEEMDAESSVSDSGAAIEAVGEELSSSSSEEDGAKAEAGRGGGGDSHCSFDDEAEFLECDENDENVPISLLSGMGGHALSVMASEVGTIISIPQQQQHRQQQQQQLPGETGVDAVLVASAPRGLAAAVSAAVASAAVTQAVPQSVQQLQLPQQTQLPEEDLEEEDDEEGLMEFDPLVFIKQLPPLESCVPQHRPTLLPRQTRTMARRKTLVLDLDETLVHSSLEAVDRSDFSFPVVFNGTEHHVYVRQRPHLLDFMVRVSALFEVVVFTASQRIYAERLLDILDPHQQLVRHRIYRDSCVVVDGNYLKDLSVLGRDLAHTVIVDNSPQAFGFQVDNGIPIESWYDDDNDMELLRLLPFLESLAGEDVEDVRPRIRLQFRLRELIDQA